MYYCIEQYESVWKGRSSSGKVESIDTQSLIGEPEPVTINLTSLKKTFKDGVQTYIKLYEKIFPRDVYWTIKKTTSNLNSQCFDPETWVKIVYSFLIQLKQQKRIMNQLIDALRIVWIGKIVAFAAMTKNKSSQQAERLIREEAKVFEDLKAFFLESF
jgi:hypothetical protein